MSAAKARTQNAGRSRRIMRWSVPFVLALLSPAPVLANEDGRLPVRMPPEARAALRAEMLDLLAALDAIVAALGAGRHADAADVAETRMGLSAMGRHRHAPPTARPGLYMPEEMHALGRGLHAAASAFARTARTGDTAQALEALGAVTGACVACHRSFRIQ